MICMICTEIHCKYIYVLFIYFIFLYIYNVCTYTPQPLYVLVFCITFKIYVVSMCAALSKEMCLVGAQEDYYLTLY